MGPQAGHVVDARVGNAGRVQPLHDLGRIQRVEHIQDQRSQLLAVGVALRIAVKARIAGQSRLQQHLLAKSFHSRSFCRPSITVPPSPASKGP
jgi:hypothetical protein